MDFQTLEGFTEPAQTTVIELVPEIDESFVAFRVTPSQMDSLWQEGWRHFGPYFFRYSKAREEFHVLPLRIRLDRFRFSTSQKRVLAKNRDLEVEFLPAFVNLEVEALFEQHTERFTHSIPSSVYTFVSRSPASIPCPCLSITVRHQQKLVGISYLDVGENSASSVYQCFDLEHSKRSLGVLMILLSIQYALEQKMEFYYPGYAYREPSEYDYKKRFSGLEVFDWEQSWIPFQSNETG